jgi:hypothetical protein
VPAKKQWEGDMRKNNRGENLIKVHYMHVGKYHKETPLYNYMLIKNEWSLNMLLLFLIKYLNKNFRILYYFNFSPYINGANLTLNYPKISS